MEADDQPAPTGGLPFVPHHVLGRIFEDPEGHRVILWQDRHVEPAEDGSADDVVLERFRVLLASDGRPLASIFHEGQ
jgi:hypothetical protein